MKKGIFLALIISLIFQSVNVYAYALNDSAIGKKWIQAGIFSENDNANDLITIGDICVVYDKIMRYNQQTPLKLSDVSVLHYTDAVYKTVAAGVLKPDMYNMTRAGEYALREEVADMTGRFLGLTQDSVEPVAYGDRGLINVHKRGYVNALVKQGAMSVDGVYFYPKVEITKGDFVKLLDTAIGGFCYEPGIYSHDTKGPVIINTADVKFRNMTIYGDLIISEGAKDGLVTLENVNVTGKVIIRTGNAKAINIDGRSKINSIAVEAYEGNVSLFIDDLAEVGPVNVAKSCESVVIEGVFGDLHIEEKANVRLRKATAQNITLSGEYNTLFIDGWSKANKITASQRALIYAYGDIGGIDVSGTDSLVFKPFQYVAGYIEQDRAIKPLFRPAYLSPVYRFFG